FPCPTLFRSAFLDLLRQLEVVAAGLRSEHRAAVAPQRRAARSDLRPSRALLPVRLLAAATDERAVLRRVRAAALRRVLPRDRFPDQVLLDSAAQDIVLELDRADLLVVCVYNVQLHGVFRAG